MSRICIAKLTAYSKISHLSKDWTVGNIMWHAVLLVLNDPRVYVSISAVTGCSLRLQI